MIIRHELTPYFCEIYRIDRKKDYPLEWIDPRTLLVNERLDLIAKLKYIEARESGQISPFIRDCYLNHIEAFSYGTFKEGGSNEKDSIEKYFAAFDRLIDTIKQSGFDAEKSVIPVGKDNILLDGAHRVAVGIYFNKELPIIRLPDAKVIYDAAYFRKRLLGERYLDFMVLESAKLKRNVHLAYVSPAIFPVQPYFKQLQQAFNQGGKLLQMKNMSIPKALERNFSTIFEHPNTTPISLKNHIKKTFSLYVFETEDKVALDRIHSQCQELFRNSRYTIYFTTDPNEAISHAEVLLDSEVFSGLAGDSSVFQRFHKTLQIESKRAYKWLIYKQRVLLLRTLKRLGLFTACRKIYRVLRKKI